MDLTIILRTCGSSGVLSNETHRICGTDRQTLVLKCVKSLIESINNITSKIPVKLYVLDDHSEKQFLTEIEDIISTCRIPFEIINLSDKPDDFKYSYNFSAYEQFRYGRDVAKDLVYMVEDDYLHSHDAIQAMLDAYSLLRNLTDLNSVALYPYDSTHNYKRFPEACRLFYITEHQRLWRTTTKTANTIFMNADDIRKYWPLFDILAREYNGDGTGANEDITINRIWNNTVNQAGPVCLFSPIPSVAIHVSFDEPVYLTPELNNWREKYDSLNVRNSKPENLWTKVAKL